MHFRLLIGVIALLPAPALAADERRLTPAQVEAILDAAALKRETSPKAVKPANDPPAARPIEGEIGATIGSHGTREIFGTAVVPVGQQGVAILSIDTAESRRDSRRRR